MLKQVMCFPSILPRLSVRPPVHRRPSSHANAPVHYAATPHFVFISVGFPSVCLARVLYFPVYGAPGYQSRRGCFQSSRHAFMCLSRGVAVRVGVFVRPATHPSCRQCHRLAHRSPPCSSARLLPSCHSALLVLVSPVSCLCFLPYISFPVSGFGYL